MRVPINFGGFGDTTADDRTSGENFLTSYISDGFYFGTPQDLITNYDNQDSSFITKIGTLIHTNNISDFDQNTLRHSIFSITSGGILDQVTNVFSDPAAPDMKTVLDALGGWNDSIVKQAEVQTIEVATPIVKTALAVAGLGALAYIALYASAAATVVSAFIPKRSANPRRKRRKPTTTSRRHLGR